MLVSTSILNANDLTSTIKKLESTSTDFIHIDVMDGIFVNNYTDFSNISSTKPLDVHLMVEDLYKYIDIYSKINPQIITFHLETKENIIDVINYIKSKNIKAGIAIKPETDIGLLEPYLNLIDIVLVLGVNPGFGGQKYIDETENRINDLDKKDRHYKIEVDGGINSSTLLKNKNADILVSGTYIIESDNYEEKIQEIRKTVAK